MDTKYSQKERDKIRWLREALRCRGRGRGNKKIILGGDKLLQWLLEYFKKNGQELDFDDLDIAFSALRDYGEITAKDWNPIPPSHPLQGKVQLNLAPLPKADHVRLWQEVVDSSHFDVETKAVLRKEAVGKRFSGFSASDMHAVILGLSHLQAIPKGEATEYIASAGNLLSSSKLISAIGKPERTALGLTEETFVQQPRYMAVAGPSKPQGGLFIENPQSFEQAVTAGISKTMALVSVYGYGLASVAKKDIESFWGESFEAEGSSLIPLIREGSPPPLETVFGLKKLFWWGDLDLAGMDIYQRLRSKFPSLQLSAAYSPMIALLNAGKGHPYAKCTGKEDQAQHYTNAKWEDEVLPLVMLCQKRAVDQEAVSQEDIIQLAQKGLDISAQNL